MATIYVSSTLLRLPCRPSWHQHFQLQYRLSLLLSPRLKLKIKTIIEAGCHEDDTITQRQQSELIQKLHRKVNGLPYAAFVDDDTVRQRGLRMVSHFDLLPYTDDKAMKMLSAQWKYHDPGNTYWTTVEECFALMTVGRVHRSVPTLTPTDDDAAHSEHEHSFEQQVAEATKRSMDASAHHQRHTATCTTVSDGLLPATTPQRSMTPQRQRRFAVWLTSVPTPTSLRRRARPRRLLNRLCRQLSLCPLQALSSRM